MNGKDLLGAMSFVEERFVDEAETQTIKKSASIGWRKWVSLAACLCVVLVGLFAFGRFGSADQTECPGDGLDGVESTQEMAQLPASEEILNEIKDELDGTAALQEAPSVVVRIVSWQEDGFLGTVAELVDTDIFEIGTELRVTMDGETQMAYSAADQTIYEHRIPTEADFPAGSLVKVQFTAYEEDTGTILVSMIFTP